MTGVRVLTLSEQDVIAADRRVDLHYGSGCWCLEEHAEGEARLVKPPWALSEGAA